MRRNKFPTKIIILSITLFCLLLIIITWETRSQVSSIEKSISYVVIPMQRGVNVFGDYVKDKITFVKNINELELLNENLQEEVDKLRYENKLLQQDKLELDHLRQLYQLDKKYPDYPTVGASVIGKDPGNWYNIFLIDKGDNNGIKVNMVVLAGNGLVGRIVEVGPNYSKVLSIIDDTSNVSSKILRTSDLCIVEGDKQYADLGYTRVEYIQETANVILGDEIVTSHLSDIYPPGILIGTIKEIKQDSHELTKYGILEPVVDFQHLEEVLIIKQVWKDRAN